MKCACGHELLGNERFCPECGEMQRFCTNGHRLSGSANFCPECGVAVGDDMGDTPDPSDVTDDLALRDTHVEQSELALGANDVVVRCGACGFEEPASTDEIGWQCGRCDANWYVETCGWCAKAQAVPEDVGDLRCLGCSKVLARKSEFAEEAIIGDVKPIGRDLLRVNSRSGVVKEFGRDDIDTGTSLATVDATMTTVPTSVGAVRPASVFVSTNRLSTPESFWYIMQCIGFGAGYFAKIPAKKALSECGFVEMTSAERFWYVLQCLAFGAGYFAKIPIKKALSERFELG